MPTTRLPRHVIIVRRASQKAHDTAGGFRDLDDDASRMAHVLRETSRPKGTRYALALHLTPDEIQEIHAIVRKVDERKALASAVHDAEWKATRHPLSREIQEWRAWRREERRRETEDAVNAIAPEAPWCVRLAWEGKTGSIEGGGIRIDYGNHLLVVMAYWRREVEAKGLAMIEGMLTLSAVPVEGHPEGWKVWSGCWMQGRKLARGYIICRETDGRWSHLGTTEREGFPTLQTLPSLSSLDSAAL